VRSSSVTPLFFDLSTGLLPISFDTIPVHPFDSVLGEGPTSVGPLCLLLLLTLGVGLLTVLAGVLGMLLGVG
jgi:hypothetical protein